MSKYSKVWYSDIYDHFTDDPQGYTQLRANESGEAQSVEWQPCKKINLADYLGSGDLINYLNGNYEHENWCPEEDCAMFPGSDIPDEKIAELDALIKQWAATVDFPWWQEDRDEPCVTIETQPQ